MSYPILAIYPKPWIILTLLSTFTNLFWCCGNHWTQGPMITQAVNVVATTCRNSTRSLLTSAKLANGLSRSGDYKRTRQGALAAFIYYIYTWLLVCATTISIWPLSPCHYLMSITHPPYVYLKATMLPTCALTSYL